MEMVADQVTQPVCSVCIANFNGMGVIDACLQSVLSQNCDFPIEIIVHDDASTDESVEFIRANYPSVKLIASAHNVGFCVSNNRMAAASHGDFLLLLNNDATLFSDALNTLFKSALSSKLPIILGLPQFNAETNELIDIGSRLDPFLNPVPLQKAGEAGMIIGACLWIPKKLWNEVGGFPDWFGSLAEDMYLCLLARLLGYPVISLPDSGFKHRVGYSLGGGKVTGNRLLTRATRRTLSERNKSFVMYLTYPAPFMHLILPLHLLLLLFEGMVLAAIKRDIRLFNSIYLACFRALWLERGRLAATRRDIQGRRICGRSDFFRTFEWIPHKIRLLFRHGIPEIR